FFFSSRRRHTRWPRDWSSDVCSSDLTKVGVIVCGIRTRAPAESLELARTAAGYRTAGVVAFDQAGAERGFPARDHAAAFAHAARSEERRVGKECRSAVWESHDEEIEA